LLITHALHAESPLHGVETNKPAVFKPPSAL